MKNMSIYKKIKNNTYFTLFMITIIFVINYKIHNLSLSEISYLNEVKQFNAIGNAVQKYSDDLTSMARLYVSTGDEKYKHIYLRLNNIIKNEDEFPQHYHTFLSSIEYNSNYNYKQALSEVDERHYLILKTSLPKNRIIRDAINKSMELSEIELRSFQLLENGKTEEALELLFSKEYSEYKFKISSSIFNSLSQKSEDSIVFLNSTHKTKQTLSYMNLFVLTLLFILKVILNIRLKRSMKMSIHVLEVWGRKVSMGNYEEALTENLPKELLTLKNIMVKLADNTLKLIRKLEQDATIDELTKLPNRKVLKDVLQENLEKFIINRTMFSVIILDIDHFKRINDKYGHPVGDQVLINVARVITENIRSSDRCIRLGGEEFLIVLPNVDSNIGYNVSETLRKKIEDYVHIIDDHEIYITVTLGISTVRENMTQREIYKEADDALYIGKKNGRNQTVIYNESMKVNVDQESDETSTRPSYNDR